MRITPLALALAVCSSISAPALAQADSAEHNALLFLDAQVLPRKAAACAARVSGYAGRFDPAFRTWLSRNRSRIASGETFLRADAEKTKMPLERDVQSITLSIFQQWSAAPLPLLQENCEEMLLQLRDAPGGG